VPDVTTGEAQEPAPLTVADEQLLRELTERARVGGLKLTGKGGLHGKLTTMVIESARKARWMTNSAAGKHDPAGRNSGKRLRVRGTPLSPLYPVPHRSAARKMSNYARCLAVVRACLTYIQIGTVRVQRSFYGYAASAELQPAWRRAPQPKHRPGLA